MIDFDQHVGKLLVSLDISTSCTPCVETTLEPSSDANAIAERVQQRIHQILREELGENMEWVLKPIEVKANGRSGIILDKEGRKAKIDKIFEDLSDMSSDMRDGVEDSIDNNPDNGKYGWWKVSGVRHECFVKASSAREASEIALRERHVGSWEMFGCMTYCGTIEETDILA